MRHITFGRSYWFVVASALLTACGTIPATTAPTSAPVVAQPVAQTNAPVSARSAPQPPTNAPAASPTLLPAEEPPASAAEFKTDFSKHSVPYREILSGGPPKDGIPAIDHPKFVSVNEADSWLKPVEPAIFFQIGDDARAYPIQIFMWHEIVNDTVGGRPVAVTYCPLCNSGLVFDRLVDGRTLDFGTSGKLYQSDLLMYDRQTHSLWAQMEGRAVVGELAGTRLARSPANTISYEDFKAIYPAGRVLSRETGHARSYGTNPYQAYDRLDSTPFLFRGQPDRRRPPKERVVGLIVGGSSRAYPWSTLATQRVIHDALAGEHLVLFYRPGAVSALDDAEIARSREVGATGVFSPAVDGRALRFEPTAEGFRDRETGSTWSLLGQAVKGPLAGKRLRPIAHVDAFWFAWAAFNPTTSVYGTP